jgi:arylsulfatase A-like enzyme
LRRMEHIIDHHNIDEPLFLFYAPHVAHCPLQVPKEYLDKFDFMQNDENHCEVKTSNVLPSGQVQPPIIKCRKQYRAMIHLLDDMIGSITQRLKDRDMWDNLLIVFTSDNGGPIRLEESGATNFPLRGGKYSPWEGGVRAAAFVSGGYVPKDRRGKVLNEPIHISDWYKTLAAIGGNDNVEDDLAARSGLPPVDAVNVAPLLMGQVTQSPRVEIPLSKQALLIGRYKLIWGDNIEGAGWSGPNYPDTNSTRYDVELKAVNCSNGCLFDVLRDPGEHVDLAPKETARLSWMKYRLTQLRENFFENDDRGVDSCPPDIDIPCACWAAVNYYGGFFGPYQEVDEKFLYNEISSQPKTTFYRKTIASTPDSSEVHPTAGFLVYMLLVSTLAFMVHSWTKRHNVYTPIPDR